MDKEAFLALEIPQGVYFVTGIDTGVGKTVVTGWLAQQLIASGRDVITQKLVQTGNIGYSEDLMVHRSMMRCHFSAAEEKLAAPAIFSYPCSPHLAAAIDKRELDLEMLDQATAQLAAGHHIVLVEGAGGLMVPLTEEVLIADYLQRHQYPLLLVTSARLGSINHTLLSLQAMKHYGLSLFALVFNALEDAADMTIANETRHYFKRVLARDFPQAHWIDVPAEANRFDV